MKTKRERICNYLRLCGEAEQTTQTIAEALQMGRENVSRVLNALAEEGLAQKSGGRPVRYRLIPRKEDDCFSNVPGADGSLRRAVQLAKAAIVYPGGKPDILLIGPRGTGKSYLAELMFRYAAASQRIKGNTPYVTFDCQDLQGGTELDSVFVEAHGGFLHIDKAQLLELGARKHLHKLRREHGNDDFFLIISCDPSNPAALDYFCKHTDIAIRLPPLAERPLEERLALVQSFLTLEAARAKRQLVISAELLRCLLLYDCSNYNILQLKGDIKMACAVAYLRDTGPGGQIHLYISDFEPYVRRGFLAYRDRREEIERIIPSDYSYTFSDSSMQMSVLDRAKLRGITLYSQIDQRAGELAASGFGADEVRTILQTEYRAMFRCYRREISRQVFNKEQLLKLVDERVIELVERFLAAVSRDSLGQVFGTAAVAPWDARNILGADGNTPTGHSAIATEARPAAEARPATDKLPEPFPVSAFYSLCLHINAMLRGAEGGGGKKPAVCGNTSRTIGGHSSNIVRLSDEKHRGEYALAARLAAEVEQSFSVSVSEDEVALLALLLCSEDETAAESHKPVILLALHGRGIAASIALALNSVVKSDNVFYCEIPLEQDSGKTYSALKECAERAHQGGGIVIFYDMEYLFPFFGLLETETNIPIRAVCLPILPFGVECARKSVTAPSVDALYSDCAAALASIPKPPARAILCLCATGEGCAEELKTYIQRNGDIGGMEVITLQSFDKERLKDQVKAIRQQFVPHCIVGRNDPKLYGIPFIPISDVLGSDPKHLPAVLRFKQREMNRIGKDELFLYLEEQLEHIDVAKLRRLLPGIVERVNRIMPVSLDTEVGLLMHLACCVNRLAGGEQVPKNLRRDEIIRDHPEAYRALRKELKPLEQAFKIIIPDDEFAWTILILYQI
ncbi:MAG: PRD domain-containing protein [Clostridiales bacterium]|nr:PRD domain-containing protein [Clostridiales bacterium]